MPRRRKAIVEFTGRVKNVEKELIPKLYRAHIVASRGEYEVHMDLHEDLKLYNIGDKVLVGVYRETPSYSEGEDLVMRAHLVSTRTSNEAKEYLFSAGGLVFILKAKRKDLEVSPLQEVYIKVSEKKS